MGRLFILATNIRLWPKRHTATNQIAYFAVKLITTVKKLLGAGRQTDYIQTDGRMDGHTHRWKDRRMDGQMDGQTDGRTDGWKVQIFHGTLGGYLTEA